MSPDEHRIITVTCFGHFMSHFNMMVFPVLILPLTKFYHQDFSQVINLSFLMYLFFGVSALPWGFVTDRLGARKMLTAFFFGAGVCALLAAMFIGSPFAFSLFLSGIGIFSGIYHPAGLGLISKGVREIGKGLGYNGMAGNLGLAFSPLITGFINWLWGPRAAYIFLGVFNLLGVGLLVFLKIPDPKQQLSDIGKTGGKGMLKAFAILCVAMMLSGIAFRGLTVTLPSLFELRNPALLNTLANAFVFFRSRNVTASILSSLVFIVGVFGQYAGGYFADHADLKRAYAVFNFLSLLGALGMAVSTNILLVATAIFYAFFLLGMQPIGNTLVARYTPERLRHAAYGTKFILTFGVGALAVRLVGWVKETWSIQAVFYVMSFVSLCVVATVLILILATRQSETG
jgi:MFS family permease